MSARSIGQLLTRAPSTITRERLRNGYQGKTEGACMGRPRIAGGYDVYGLANELAVCEVPPAGRAS